MFNLEIMMIEQDYYDKTIIMIKQEEINHVIIESFQIKILFRLISKFKY